MNPSGDFGKRELSPALRNRFTEIWCTSITSSESISTFGGKQFFFKFILKIIKFTLSDILTESVQKENIARSICDLFVFTNVTWSQVLKPLSIRDLKSLMELIKGMWEDLGLHSIFAAVYLVIEGQLGISKAQMERLQVYSKVRNALKVLYSHHSLLTQGLKVFQNLKIQLSSEKLQINNISLTRKIIGEDQTSNGNYVLTNQKVLSNLMRVMMGLKSSKAILMEGPPGVGKTSLVLHLGKLLGKKVHRINLNEQTDLLDLLGFDVPDPHRPGKIICLGYFIKKILFF